MDVSSSFFDSWILWAWLWWNLFRFWHNQHSWFYFCWISWVWTNSCSVQIWRVCVAFRYEYWDIYLLPLAICESPFLLPWNDITFLAATFIHIFAKNDTFVYHICIKSATNTVHEIKRYAPRVDACDSAEKKKENRTNEERRNQATVLSCQMRPIQAIHLLC